MQICSACWRENEQLLRSQGLDEASVSRVWAAVAGYVRENFGQGRGVNLPGVCKLLQPRAKGSNSSTAGLRIVLSDKLLKRFPNLQLGAGMSHHAAVKDQVQGAEDINHIRLAQRCQGLSRDAVQLILKTMVSTITHLLELQQTFTLDLGAGQLRFKAGRIVEFRLSSSVSPPDQQAASGTASSCSSGESGLTAEALSQLGESVAGPAACKSTVSRGSKASRSSATTQAAAASTSGQAPTMTSSSLLISPITATGGTSSRSPGQRRPCDLPGKPCSTPLSPIDIITASRQAKAAAVANARVKPAIFVLPVGAPGEPDEPRVPQGKGKATAAEDQARQQVLQAAAVRHGIKAASQAAAEAELMAKNTALRQALDAQAQAMKQQQAANKKQLADTLAQQIREKQTARPPHTGGGSLMLGKTTAQMSTMRLKQQAEYRAALDEQLAIKASEQQQHRAEDNERALAELQKLQRSVVAAAEASRSSRQQAVATVKQQLDMQMINSKLKDDW